MYFTINFGDIYGDLLSVTSFIILPTVRAHNYSNTLPPIPFENIGPPSNPQCWWDFLTITHDFHFLWDTGR